MTAARDIPMAIKRSEQQLVEDMAEGVADHGYKVSQHTVKHDHEREETTLTVRFIKANPNQGVLKLEKNGERNGGEDESRSLS